MVLNKRKLFTIIFLILISFSINKDVSTFSNYEIIKQTNLELNFNIDFKNKVVNGIVKSYFTALKDGEVIVLDTKDLNIHSVIDSDTGEELEFILDKQFETDSLGIPLKIYKTFDKDEQITILIKCSTTKDALGIGWLEPEQTAGKVYPFMYSQGEMILNRGLFPCQDTPSIKTPVSTGVTVEKPLLALNSGLYKGKIDNGDTVTYFYEQKVPIPSYLVVIAAGAIEERIITDRTKIYGEKEYVDLAALIYGETEDFIEYGEAYLCPYVWGEYNILVLPSSFPYGGLENPTLTYITASFLSEDKSMVPVITHEVTHSWSGNLVTMDNWTDFWLNEGFTMFIQRKIMEKLNDPELIKLDAMVGYEKMGTEIYTFGESKSFTQLRPYLQGRNPNDAFSLIPYEKGFNFLYYLESVVNPESDIDLFRKILRVYFDKYKYKSIHTEDFKELFIEQLKEELPSKYSEILAKIDWVKWLDAPGLPPNKNDFSNKYVEEIERYVSLFYEGKLPDDFENIFKTQWHFVLKSYFLSKIQVNDTKLDNSKVDYLTNTLNLKEGYNVEINVAYYLIVLLHGTEIKDDFKENLISFLGKHGRINYIRPLYTAFLQRDRETAIATFEKYRNFYHKIVVEYIEILIKTL